MRRRYGTSNASAEAGINEPCTINADVIADYLDSQQKPRMAGFVRRIGQTVADLEARNADLYQRLQVHEPPPQQATTPGRRRSQWD